MPNKRVWIIHILIGFTFIGLFLRLFDIMVVKHEWYVKKAKRQTIANEDVQVRRGFIFDRNGRSLVVNLENDSIFAYKNRLKLDSRVLSKLSKAINLNNRKIISKLKKGKNFVWLKRKVPAEISKRVEKLRIQGIEIIPDPKRYYKTAYLAAHVLGFVDIDNKGLEGIEKEYNRELINKGGKIYFKRDAKGNRFYTSAESEKMGNSIVLTIDEGLQFIMEKEIDAAMKKWKAQAATVIMINPYTGAILSLVNRPTFNPNNPGKYKPSLRRNRAITDFYEPGSTFKIVTAAAILEEGLANLYEVFDCSKGYIIVGRKRIRDAHRHKKLTFMEIIQKSSNVGTVMLAERLGKKRLYAYIQKFGFGSRTGIDLPGEVAGLVRTPERWSGVSIGSVAIGQEIGVTALQMVTAYSMIANGGYSIKPHVVNKVITPGSISIDIGHRHESKRIFSEKTVEILKKALIMVTKEGGTAKNATIDGNTVAGKTGTAQIFDFNKGKYSHKDFVSSFIGFVPVEKPIFTMIVTLWKPREEIYGGIVAAPVFRRIAKKALAYLDVPRDEIIDSNILVVKNEI